MSKDRLSKKQEDQLLDDFSMVTAVLIAQQEYLKSIGKEEEARAFVQKYLADMAKDKIKKKVN